MKRYLLLLFFAFFGIAHSQNYKVPDILCPCGGCLQVMSETENRQKEHFDILLKSETAILKAKGVAQFLPFSFVI